MLKVYNVDLKSLFVGEDSIQSAYVGSTQVFNAIPSYNIILDYEIPEGAGGSISGGGTFKEGETITVVATPQEGSRFVGWYVNGTVVSTNESYTFTVTGDMTLIAVFGKKQSIVYYKKAANLTASRSQMAGASTNKYAIFIGGVYNNATYSTVWGYTSALTSITNATLSYSRANAKAASFDDWVIVGGGTSSSTTRSTVESFNNSLTNTKATSSIYGAVGPGIARMGENAIFAGGSTHVGTASAYYWYNALLSYNKSLTRTVLTATLSSKRETVGVRANNKIIFGGGYLSATGISTAVDGFDSEFTRTTATVKMAQRVGYSAATAGKYGIFAGGYTYISSSWTYYNNVEAYDDSLTRIIPASLLSTAKGAMASASLGEYAVFFGGRYLNYNNTSSASYKTVEAYDSNLVRTLPQELTNVKSNATAVTLGDKTIVAGGDTTKVVDVYTLQ